MTATRPHRARAAVRAIAPPVVVLAAVASCGGGEAAPGDAAGTRTGGGGGAGRPDPDRRLERLAELGDRYGTGPGAVGACMAAAGFEFVVAPDAERTATASELELFEVALDNAEQIGYGIVLSSSDGADAAETDPNAAIVAELDPDARTKYYEALDGANSVHEVGCRDLIGDDGGAFAPTTDERSALQQLVDEALTPDVTAGFVRDWSSCMAADGFTGLDEQPDAEAYARDQVAAIIPDLASGHGDGNDGAVASRQLGALDDDVLAQALAIERAVAVADATCHHHHFVLPAVQRLHDVNAIEQLVDVGIVESVFGAVDG